MNYKEFTKKNTRSVLAEAIIWSSLSTFAIVIKPEVGTNNIPIFETLGYVISLVTMWYMRRNITSIKNIFLIDIVFRTIIVAMVLIGLTIYGIAPITAIMIYLMWIITNSFIGLMMSESFRVYEDRHIRSATGKTFLRMIRSKCREYHFIGSCIGAGISLLLLTFFKMDILNYGILMMGLEIVVAIYDIYLYIKYLR